MIPLNHNVYQTVGQSVLLGCLVNSNPESTVVWYKKNKNLTNGTNDFESIDVSQSNYQIHKFKQMKVYYFKIKVFIKLFQLKSTLYLFEKNSIWN